MANEIPVEATAALAAKAAAQSSTAPSHLRLGVLSGSAIMLLSSIFVGAMNLIYNFVVAHKLGADKFGHASVVYTLLMLLSSVTLSFQLVCSKYVARSESADQKIAIYKLLHRWSWLCGVALGAFLALASGTISGYLNLPATALILLLAAATVFYVPLGVRRGFMQGTYDFRPLAINFALEVVVKLFGALVLITPYEVRGVVAAMAASVAVAYFLGVPRKHHVQEGPGIVLRAGFGEGVQAATFFVGQVIINNLDIVLVKHFFDPTQAGVYAAVALVGRVVYMLSWSVVSSMFPFSAGIRVSDDRGRHAVLSTALGLVAVIATLFTLAVWLAPPQLWHVLLGSGFPVGQHRFYSSLLMLYALTTALYSLGVVLMTYEISQKIGNVSWVQLGFSAAIIVGIYLFHSTLQAVILVQLVLMLVLLLVVSVPFIQKGYVANAGPLPVAAAFSTALSRLRRVNENEVIAQFLQSEFYQEEFRQYWDIYADVVTNPDLHSQRQNALRRALLFHRRGRLWREIPADTQWWEVELTPEDVKRVRVFARNHWLRYGAPNFLLLDMVEKLRSRMQHSRDPFIAKLRSLADEVTQDAEYSSVILITTDGSAPFTILEGNHRMTAAALAAPETLHRRFRFICGFSPRMAECCWYRTDASTLWRYAVNTLAYYFIDRHKLTTAVLRAETTSLVRQNTDAA